MAYGLKYELLCKSKLNNSYSLKLLFRDYTNADIDRNMPGESPLVLRKDKAAVIRGTSLDYAIREAVDFELDEFYSNDPKKIKAELYKGSTLIWAGYNLPQQYQAPYIPVPVTTRFTATDGLGLLKNEKYNQTGNNSELAMIVYCIDKIELGLGYSIAINLFEAGHASNRTPLAQTYQDASIHNGKNCLQVIEAILKKYDAEITQVGGRWHITCSADKKSTRMLYTSAGVYESTEAAPAVLDLGYPGVSGIEVWPIGQLNRSMEAGAKSVTLSHNFRRKKSFLTNYDFWNYSGGQFTGWTKTGSFSLWQKIKDGKAYAKLQGYTTDNTQGISQLIEVTKVEGEDFVFELDFAAIGSARTTLTASRISMLVRVKVTLTDGVTTYYLGKDGWSTTDSEISETISASIAGPVWNRLKIITPELPVSGDMTVKLFRFYSASAPRPGDTWNGVCFSEPCVYFLNDGELYPSSLSSVALFDDSTEPEDMGEIAIEAADAPELDNSGLIYDGISRLSDGTPTLDWTRTGEATAYPIIVQLARLLASRKRIALQKLAGTIKGGTLGLNSIIKHTYNSNREFEIAECRWDIHQEKWTVTLTELLAWSSEDITFTNENGNENAGSASTEGASIGVSIGNDGGYGEVFEIVNAGTEDEYLRVKLPIASDGNIQGYTDSGQFPATLWDSMPAPTTTSRGGIILGSGSSKYLREDGTWQTVESGIGSYPGAGIVVSTGSGWGTSITDNSAHWNTAYGWGNWASNFGTTTGKICQGDDSRLSDSRPASDVYAWAKASAKPSYNATEVGLGNVTNESKAIMFTSPTFTGNVGIGVSATQGLELGSGKMIRMNTYSHLSQRYSACDTWIGQNCRAGQSVNQIELGSPYIDGGASALQIGWDSLGFYRWTSAMLAGKTIGDPLTLPTPDFYLDSGNISVVGYLKGATLKTSNWTFEESGNDLLIKRGSTVLAKISSAGVIQAADNIQGGVTF